MSETADRNVSRYSPVPPFESRIPKGSRFCLAGLIGYESADPAINDKREQLIKSLGDEFATTSQTLECTIGGCNVSITEDTKKGEKIRRGECVAASYCLKKAFEAVPGDDGVDAGKKRYSEIIDTCEGRSSNYAAGNFCPKIDCGLSAGVSMDMIPGTSGACAIEVRSSQDSLFIV